MTSDKSVIPLFIKKPEVEDYLRYLFNAPARGPIQIHRNNDAGRFINSRITYLGYSGVKGPDECTVQIVLPLHRNSIHKNRFAYFTREDMDRINDYLLADFNLTFRAYMLVGEEWGIEKKDLLEGFMAGTGMRHVGVKYDTLKKKDYRHRKKIFNILVSSLQGLGIELNKKSISDLSP